MTLIQRITALHVVYQLSKSRVLWFGQLVSLSPGIMIHLQKEKVICDSTEMVYKK